MAHPTRLTKAATNVYDAHLPTSTAQLKAGAIAGASLSVPWRWLASPTAARGVQSSNLRKFIQPLRGVGGSGIPVAQPDTVNPGWWKPGVTHYSIDIAQFSDQLHVMG